MKTLTIIQRVFSISFSLLLITLGLVNFVRIIEQNYTSFHAGEVFMSGIFVIIFLAGVLFLYKSLGKRIRQKIAGNNPLAKIIIIGALLLYMVVIIIA